MRGADKMPRPCKKKCVSSLPAYSAFIPTEGKIPASHINMSIEEYETLRLIDYVGLNQTECAQRMMTSRGSVQLLYDEARCKLARFLVEGSAITITGGNYQLDLTNKPTGDDTMKIAVTYENGQVFQHFGHTQMFKLYEIKDHEITATELLDTKGSGHSALVTLLKANQVDTLICGGIGGGAKNALAEAGIQLYGGACGAADAQVASFLNGSLQYNPDVHCSHHGEGHTCKTHEGHGHSCGSTHL